jgi:hypothetical protein
VVLLGIQRQGEGEVQLGGYKNILIITLLSYLSSYEYNCVVIIVGYGKGNGVGYFVRGELLYHIK